jgi:NAD(P)-dependent dehydrogenase (short-subunit alcohol dehydrogenase family)
LTAHFVLTRLVLSGMVAQGGGVITNVSSVNAIQALGNPAYSAAKAGLISFTQTLAIGYGPKGIRSNAVLPGTVETPVWRHRVEARPEVLELVKSWYPQGRVGQPEDIAAAVAFLSADEAGFVNGTSLTVDGGLTAGNFRMIQDIIGK